MSLVQREEEKASSNEVRLVGRLAVEPVPVELPSGDVVVTFRVVVDRGSRHRSRQKVDALECAAWTAKTRRRALSARPGDVVEVCGALRRRFFRTAGGAASRVEVEAAAIRVLRRATDA